MRQFWVAGPPAPTIPMAQSTPTSLLCQPNFAATAVFAWLVVALLLLLQHWPQTAETLNDTDDAMRLAGLRAWLNGPSLIGG